jgi:hypothetical protein
MGYIGLLLNAPYKIDSMVWMRLMMSFVIYFGFDFLSLSCGYMNPGDLGSRGFKICAIKNLMI